MKKKLSLILFSLLLLFSLNAESATCTALASDDWTKAGTWSCGRAPTCGDIIIIPAGITVTVNTQINLAGCGSSVAITVFGTLTFDSGKKLDLACGSTVSVPGPPNTGKILGAGGGGSSNLISICAVNVWTAGTGTFTNGLLPIDLIYFNAKASDKNIETTWATASEENNKLFTVEKSKNAIDFIPVGEVAGAINSNYTRTYNLVDEHPYYGLSYYRLKQTDLNNNTRSFQIVPVEFKGKRRFDVFPNPTHLNTNASLNLSGYKNQHITLQIVDVTGKLSQSTKQFITDDNFEITQILKTDLEAGVYFISVIDETGNKVSQKLMIY